MQDVCRFPIVFVHGLFGWGSDEGINRKLPYWGATTGDLTVYLNGLGYESYSASVGPISSAWDRACELYARLTGSTVDYGKAHSVMSNHRRFGRTYDTPLVEGWSETRKLHLIGHSFGGNTIRLFAYLLEHGDASERAATDPDDLSPLFAGGRGDLVQSVTTLCSPHNGTMFFDASEHYRLLPVMKAVAYNYVGLMGRTPAEGGFVDFHLEQYGMSDTPGKKDAFPLRRAKKEFKGNEDNTEYDMGREGAAKLNKRIAALPNVYYFSYAYNAVTRAKSDKRNKVSETDFPALRATSSLILFYNRFQKPEAERSSRNDGLVQVESALHPANEPFQTFDPADLRPGVWNVMPVQTGDHGTPIGLFADPDKTHRLYLDHLALLRQTEQQNTYNET